MLKVLEVCHLDLGYPMLSRGRRLARRIGKLAKGHLCDRFRRLGARFEFSMLPVDGGRVLPYTDSPGKMVTLIVSILDDD